MLEEKEGKMRYSKELSKLLLPNLLIESSYRRILRLDVEVRIGMLTVRVRSWTYRMLQCELDVWFLPRSRDSFPAIDPVVMLVH